VASLCVAAHPTGVQRRIMITRAAKRGRGQAGGGGAAASARGGRGEEDAVMSGGVDGGDGGGGGGGGGGGEHLAVQGLVGAGR